MVTTAFSDEIVNVSKFRGNQSSWLTKALMHPITVTNGDIKVTILNRELVRELYTQKHYSELIIKFCSEFDNRKDFDTFPWVAYLDEEEQKEFRDELINNFLVAIETNNWNSLETLIEDWKATAETEHDEEAMAAIKSTVRKDKYIPRKSR